MAEKARAEEEAARAKAAALAAQVRETKTWGVYTSLCGNISIACSSLRTIYALVTLSKRSI